jgi:hypothetical protein
MFSVIINGNHHGKFKSERGIRQGCPLSPYLFVTAINELAVELQDELQRKNLQGVILGLGCPPIYSLIFADDLLVWASKSDGGNDYLEHNQSLL